MDSELILEDEVGELLLPDAALTSTSEKTFDPALVDENNATPLCHKPTDENALTEVSSDTDAQTTASLGNNEKLDRLLIKLEELTELLSNQYAPGVMQDPQNQFNTGVHYAKHKIDDYQAARWFRKAAMQGHAKAQFYLGVFFMKGQGVPKSYFHAYSWLSLAACQHLNQAVQARKQLESHLTTQETNAALKYSADLFEQMRLSD